MHGGSPLWGWKCKRPSVEFALDSNGRLNLSREDFRPGGFLSGFQARTWPSPKTIHF